MQTESFGNITGVPSNYGDVSPPATARNGDSVVRIKFFIPTTARCRMTNARWHGGYAARNLHPRIWKSSSSDRTAKDGTSFRHRAFWLMVRAKLLAPSIVYLTSPSANVLRRQLCAWPRQFNPPTTRSRQRL